MQAVGRDEVRGLLLLSLAAGSADAVGYLGLGRVFTSNMTGNLVLLGIDIGQGHLSSTARSLFVLLVFTLGVGIGVWMDEGVEEKNWPRLAPRLLAFEKIALILFALGWIAAAHASSLVDMALLLLLSFTMGVQSAAMNRLKAPGVGTTAITGTLTALTMGIVAALIARSWRDVQARVQFQAGVVVLYCVGAVSGGFLILHLPWLAGCLPALAALLVTVKKARLPSG